MSTATAIAAEARRRTVSWEDPAAAFAKAARLSGLEYLRAVKRGEFPSPAISRFFDTEAVEFEPGRAVFASTPGEHHYSLIGRVHGGVIATLLDSALGCAVHTELDAGEGYTTAELSVNFVRPIGVETGRMVCEGRVLHLGRTLATAEARLESEATGKLHAHAKATLLIRRRPSTEFRKRGGQR